jgi:hypothetical protein
MFSPKTCPAGLKAMRIGKNIEFRAKRLGAGFCQIP